jgi:5-methylcytosine-specific restriction enzyme A
VFNAYLLLSLMCKSRPHPKAQPNRLSFFYLEKCMPIASPKPCKSAGCGRLVRDGSGFCGVHLPAVLEDKKAKELAKRLAYDKSDERKAAKRFYDSAAWKRIRYAHLCSSPLCVECIKQDQITAATHVDHIRPWCGDLDLAMDASNLQSMCRACRHSSKTASEDGGFGHRRRGAGQI